MATYMNETEIQNYLQEGLEEMGTVQKAFDYLLENEINDIFEMNQWDEPKFYETTIAFNDKKYKVVITEDGCIESTNEHKIMDWKWCVNAL